MLDLFSLEILERTVELALDAMPPEGNPRVGACATAIRDCIQSLNADSKKLEAAVNQLLSIARSNGQFFIVARLLPIVRELAEDDREPGVRSA